MARKASTLAALDIAAEGLAQQDGLAERLARQRNAGGMGQAIAGQAGAGHGGAGQAGAGQGGADTPASANRNAWRRGKALLQVAIPEEAHVELSILAKRRRVTLSQLVKAALNQWLDSHGHTLRLPD